MKCILSAQNLQHEKPPLEGALSLESFSVEEMTGHCDLLRQNLIQVLCNSECITFKSFIWSFLV